MEKKKNRIATCSSCATEPLMNHGSSPESNGGVPLDSPTPTGLVVDDDPMIRGQLVQLYTSDGYTVVAVSSGEEALAQLADGNIDFVVTDIKLPGLSGIDLIADIQENFPDVPVIAITGSSNIDTAVSVLKLGAADFL